ncbi:MAG: hypothetical protein LBD85_01200 [Oscillospiraceae bacterium]|nr:hypothetical protein [Oscillospiraceae bacterium]
MSNDNYESPVVHAIEGADAEELLEATLDATCHVIYCAQSIDYISGPAGSSCAPPTSYTYCNAAANYCSVQYSF